jgi:hypothetical protein
LSEEAFEAAWAQGRAMTREHFDTAAMAANLEIAGRDACRVGFAPQAQNTGDGAMPRNDTRHRALQKTVVVPRYARMTREQAMAYGLEEPHGG